LKKASQKIYGFYEMWSTYIFNLQDGVLKCSTYPEQEIGTKTRKFWGKVRKTPFLKEVFQGYV